MSKLKYKKGDVVSYLFGDASQFKIITTKEEPYKRVNMPTVKVEEGRDYIIVKYPLSEGEFGAFIHVPEAHLELISSN
ncbi:MAG: hypothetical protein ACK50A_00405 [Sphingobacteriaceae bacterium]|jgi:hypothetical protein